MLRMLKHGLAMALVLVAGTAMAYPTLTGPTGLLTVPNAETAAPGITVAADWYDIEVGDSFPIRATLGLGGFEVGAFFDPFDSDALLDEAMGANAKFQLGRILGGDSALGAQFRRESDVLDVDTDFWQGYFAWTTRFGETDSDSLSNISLTWGVNWTQVDPEIGDTEDAFRFFAGVTVDLSKNITLLAEYQSEDEDLGDVDPITSVAARLYVSPTLALQAGYTNAFGLLGSDEHNFTFGAMLNFGSGE